MSRIHEDDIRKFHPDPEGMEREIGLIEEKEKRGPLLAIIAVFILMLFVLMIIPHYSVKMNPEPQKIPKLDEVLTDRNFSFNTYEYENPYDMPQFVESKDPTVKGVADRIATQSCPEGGRICHAKAMFYFVRDNFEYVNDPARYEYVKTAKESFLNHGGDCDDASVLLATLEEAVGVPARFIFIPGHVYVQIFLPEAPARYKQEGWISLDPTCQSCGFGEVPYKNIGADNRVVG
ncbi:transglutaminase domain-containing protein [Candidatus Woesearchaeota archaeon]|nr:transglutaminase domain-containing protein [Candidatus Woesearchaeota archaeon]